MCHAYLLLNRRLIQPGIRNCTEDLCSACLCSQYSRPTGNHKVNNGWFQPSVLEIAKKIRSIAIAPLHMRPSPLQTTGTAASTAALEAGALDDVIFHRCFNQQPDAERVEPRKGSPAGMNSRFPATSKRRIGFKRAGTI